MTGQSTITMNHMRALARRIQESLEEGDRQFCLQGAEMDWAIMALHHNQGYLEALEIARESLGALPGSIAWREAKAAIERVLEGAER